jgi:hypothetical protein
MRTKELKILLVIMSVFLFASTVIAPEWQGFRGSERWGLGHPYQNMYNPKGIETYSGEVIS